MQLLATFFGAFYSPDTYLRARHEATGWGIGYSVFLLIFPTIFIVVSMVVFDTGIRDEWHLDKITMVGIAAMIVFVSLLMRAAMLATLTIATRLLGYAIKSPLSNAAAARLTAVAYTPVAVCDAAAFLLTSTMVSPPMLFALGTLMALAALIATK